MTQKRERPDSRKAPEPVQLFDLKGKLIDRVHAENIGCEYGEYC